MVISARLSLAPSRGPYLRRANLFSEHLWVCGEMTHLIFSGLCWSCFRLSTLACNARTISSLLYTALPSTAFEEALPSGSSSRHVSRSEVPDSEAPITAEGNRNVQLPAGIFRCMPWSYLLFEWVYDGPMPDCHEPLSAGFARLCFVEATLQQKYASRTATDSDSRNAKGALRQRTRSILVPEMEKAVEMKRLVDWRRLCFAIRVLAVAAVSEQQLCCSRPAFPGYNALSSRESCRPSNDPYFVTSNDPYFVTLVG